MSIGVNPPPGDAVGTAVTGSTAPSRGVQPRLPRAVALAVVVGLGAAASTAAGVADGASPSRAAATNPTVPFPVALPFPVVVDYQATASNDLGQTNQTRLAIGPAYRAADAPMVTTDRALVCAAGPNDAVFPFYVETHTYGGGTATSRFDLSFSQTTSGTADATAHPMTIQFDYADGASCIAATSPDTTTTDARVVWDTMTDTDPEWSAGYFIVADYWDGAGAAVGATSAVLAISPTINARTTTGQFEVYGPATVVSYEEPSSGSVYAAIQFG